MQEGTDSEKKIRKIQSDEYKIINLNINTITNMSHWDQDDWDDLDEIYSNQY